MPGGAMHGRSLVGDPLLFQALVERYIEQHKDIVPPLRATCEDVTSGLWYVLCLMPGRERAVIDRVASVLALPCYLPLRRHQYRGRRGTWHNQWRALFKGYAFAQARDIRLHWERLRSLGVLALLHEGGRPEVPKVIPARVIDLVREVERKVGPIGRRGF
jgi:hypothetical protein